MSQVIQVILSPDEHKRIKQRALDEGVSMSTLLLTKYQEADTVASPPDDIPDVEDLDTDVGRNGKRRSGELFVSQMPQILLAMNDVNYQPSEVLRLISIEQAAVVNEMSDQITSWGIGGQGKRLEVKLKALTNLSKTVMDAEELSRKDILNLEGPKFEHVFTRLCEWMKDAITTHGISPEQANNILKTFGDKAGTGQIELQRELDQIDSN